MSDEEISAVSGAYYGLSGLCDGCSSFSLKNNANINTVAVPVGLNGSDDISPFLSHTAVCWR